MARHNREGRGTDQYGLEYGVSYQPDWLQVVKVTRRLENDRRSTRSLFRNPGRSESAPGDRVRTRITSPSQGLDIGLTIADPGGVVRRVIIETELPALPGERSVAREEVIFTIESRLPPPPPATSPRRR